MKFIFNFKSEYMAKISIENYHYILQENENKKLSIPLQKEVYVNITPINNLINQYPIFVKLSFLDGMLISSSKHITIIKLDTYYFEICILKTNIIFNDNLQVLTTKENDIVIVNNKYITFMPYEKPVICALKSNYPIHNFKTKTNNDNVILYGKTNKYCHLVIFNRKTKNFKQLVCSSFRIDDDKLQTATHYNDYAKHIKIENYSLNKNFEKIESYVAYKKRPRMINCEQIIPYVFLENIKANDLKEARLYLSSDFNALLSNEMLQQFFGGFVSITTPQILTKPFSVCLIYKMNEGYYISKYFNFEIQDKKITNIIEL